MENKERDFEIYGCEHIGVVVSDLEKSKEFYCGILGMEVIFEKAAIVPAGKILTCFVKLGNVVLDLEQYPEPQAWRREGLIDHVCFGVKNMPAAVEYLKGKGVHFESEKPTELPDFFDNGLQFIFFRGPDNEILELQEFF